MEVLFWRSIFNDSVPSKRYFWSYFALIGTTNGESSGCKKNLILLLKSLGWQRITSMKQNPACQTTNKLKQEP